MERSRECILGRRRGCSKSPEMGMCFISARSNEETGLLKIFVECLPCMRHLEDGKEG